MKTLMLVLAALAMGTLASATTLGFLSYTGGILYCNYEQLSPASSFGPSAWQGTDNLSACGSNINATIVGVSGSGHFVDVSNSTGKKINIKGVLYGDNLYDAFSPYSFTGAQWFVASNLVPDTNPKKFGWFGLASYGGLVFGNNYGHLTTQIPTGNVASHGTSAGTFKK